MVNVISRRLFLGGAGATVAGPLWANAPLTSPWPVPRPGEIVRRALPPVETLLAQARLGGKVGFVVADAQNGEVLESSNPLLALPPASVAKAVTSAYGLATLGADYRFRTRLIATGPVTAGRIDGDLVLAGGGDPMLDTDQLADLGRDAEGRGCLFGRGAVPRLGQGAALPARDRPRTTRSSGL